MANSMNYLFFEWMLALKRAIWIIDMMDLEAGCPPVALNHCWDIPSAGFHGYSCSPEEVDDVYKFIFVRWLDLASKKMLEFMP